MQTTMTRPICATLALLFAAACARVPLKDNVLNYIPTDVGDPRTKSMGDPMLTKYTCPCYELFEAKDEITFAGYDRAVVRGSEWVARYVDTESNERYLTNRQFHRALALVLAPGGPAPKLSADHALKQIQGSKQGRSWVLSDPAHATALHSSGYLFTRTAWRLQYIGPDKQRSKVLRFTIDDLGSNRERVGQVEYTHDLNNGAEFVVRGVRFRIMNVAPDGLITYVVVSDAAEFSP